MGGVNQTVATVDRDLIEQVFNRSATMHGQTLFDFPALLGDVDVQRAVVPEL